MNPEPDYPAYWIKGQLLDVRRYTDGSYLVKLLNDEKKDRQELEFPNQELTQNFVSWWYQRDAIR